MEASTHKTTHIEPQTHPFYFAHYLNMARHNAYVILSTISEDFNFIHSKETGKQEVQNLSKTQNDNEKENAPKIQENTLHQLKLYNNKHFKNMPDELAKRDEMLLKHFLFLREVKNESSSNSPYTHLTQKLKQALELLNDLRNGFSHYPPITEHQTEIELNPYFPMALDKAQKRMSPYFSDDDFSLLKNDDKGVYQLYCNGELTLKGLCFFTCFFLEKKYAFQFLSGIHGFKDTREHKYRATLEVFTENCCRLPYPKLESSDFKLDILNELSRCPNALFNVLDDKKQEKFVTSINTTPENKHDGSENEEEKQKVIMKRHSNRFPYFALRYFDESNILDGISFHVHLGKWTKSTHRKKIIKDRERIITKNIRAFGEPLKFDKSNVPVTWDIDQFEQYAPSFRIVGNRVGITLKNNLRNQWPRLNNNIAPDAIISTYEFPNLFVYALLYKQGKIDTSPSNHIKTYTGNIKQCISDVQQGNFPPVQGKPLFKNRKMKGDTELLKRKQILQERLTHNYKINISDLPDDIKYFLLGYEEKNDKAKALQFLKSMQRKTKYNQNRAEKLRAGDMAQTLAEDIIFLSPPFIHEKNGIEHKQKLNDKEYDILQKALAYYPANKYVINELFKNHKIFTSERKHPFLNQINVFKQKSIYDFYKAYFEAKNKWLSNLIGWFDRKSFSMEKLLNQYDYFIKTINKNITEKRYENLPALLPRGLFNAPIIKAMKLMGYPLNDSDNIAYAIKLLTESHAQQFYSHDRYYNKNNHQHQLLTPDAGPQTLFDEITIKLEHIDRVKDEEKYKEFHYCKKDISESEKEIRYCMQTDRVLWLMLKDLFPEGQNMRNRELETIDFKEENNKESILNKEHEVCETIYKKYQISDKLPAKRYGEFRKFLKDRRLENLLKYYNSEYKIPREKLVHELENYDLKRKEILELIYNFEKIVHTKYQTEEIINSLGENNLKKYEDTGIISHSAYLEFVCKKFNYELPIKGDEDYSFAALRNKLLHNEIPQNTQLDDIVNNPENHDSLVTQKLFDIIMNVYTDLIKTIKTNNHGHFDA